MRIGHEGARYILTEQSGWTETTHKNPEYSWVWALVTEGKFNHQKRVNRKIAAMMQVWQKTVAVAWHYDHQPAQPEDLQRHPWQMPDTAAYLSYLDLTVFGSSRSALMVCIALNKSHVYKIITRGSGHQYRPRTRHYRMGITGTRLINILHRLTRHSGTGEHFLELPLCLAPSLFGRRHPLVLNS